LYIVFHQQTREAMVEFTISELEEKTGMNRRTIHFYVKEGVIDPPSGLGGGARYNEQHLLRLLLTRELQKSHLKLSGIKETLDRMSLDEMRELERKAAHHAPTQGKNTLELWLESKLPGGERLSGKAAPPNPMADPWNFSFLDLAKGLDSPKPEKAPAPSAATPRHGQPAPGKAERWERLKIIDGVELHIRSDLASPLRRQLWDRFEWLRQSIADASPKPAD
jgi:DNA-binding transcriptional MerR regulator